MQKIMLLVICCALLPAAAGAQEKSLGDVTEDAVFLAEAYAACAEREGACTAADLQAVEAGAQNCLRDLVDLLKSRDRSRMTISAELAVALNARAKAAREKLAHIAIADESCNAGIYYFVQLVTNLSYLVQLLNPVTLIFVIMFIGLPAFIHDYMVILATTLWSLVMTVALSPSCLLWWL